MFKQTKLGATEREQKKEIQQLIKNGSVAYAGNQKLKIYGRLDCSSGKRMKAENRVFFEDEVEALQQGYRPCAHCMPMQYREWKERSN